MSNINKVFIKGRGCLFAKSKHDGNGLEICSVIEKKNNEMLQLFLVAEINGFCQRRVSAQEDPNGGRYFR